jgi:molecular chaperone GrpE
MNDDAYKVPIEGPDPGDEEDSRQPEDEPQSEASEGEAGEAVTDERLEQDLEELTREIDSMRDQYLRALADLDNYRRRSAREREDAATTAVVSVLRDMLPVLDNLDRAAAAASEAESHASLLEGVELIRRQFLAILDKRGVTQIRAVGEPFDPLWHEAVGKKATESHAEGTVVEETQKGYRLGGLIIRPAKVVVAVAPGAEPSEEQI